MTSKPGSYTTIEWMRVLADAVDDLEGINFQPIHPPTLREWADKMEKLEYELQEVIGCWEEYDHHLPATSLRERMRGAVMKAKQCL